MQAAYFDRILGRANTRLLIMSGGQYELRRCERAGDNRSQTGLELEVVDHYNGTARSVKTLSGGETFAASLSLALGLSDEVQSSAGGVQLEAMFVDEGFGSLDSEALQQALTALVGGFTKTLAAEVYEQGIRVHLISPGGVFTDMAKVSRPDLTGEEMITAEDIAEIAAFLVLRRTNAVIDEIEVHRANKAPFA